MLLPITTVTFDAPEPYKILGMDSYFANVFVHTLNGNGDVLCSFKLPQLKLEASKASTYEQLVQISLNIWAMNVSL